MNELKPCPFCGGGAYVSELRDGMWRAICMSCNASGNNYFTEAEAVKAWNTRIERTCHETTIDKFFRGCDSCGYMWEVFYGIGKRERPNYCPNCGAKVASE